MKKQRDRLQEKADAARLRRSVAHFQLDMGLMELSFQNGTVHLSGVIKRLGRDMSVDLRKTVDKMCRELQEKNSAVREVVTAFLRIMD